MSAVVSLQTDAQGAFQGVENGQALIYLFFKVTPAGNYASPGGDVLDFTVIGDFIKSGRPPLQVQVWSQKAGGGSGFMYGYSPGNPATQANGKFQVFTGAAAQSALTELANGAYPAGVLGDVIVGMAIFPRV